MVYQKMFYLPTQGSSSYSSYSCSKDDNSLSSPIIENLDFTNNYDMSLSSDCSLPSFSSTSLNITDPIFFYPTQDSSSQSNKSFTSDELVPNNNVKRTKSQCKRRVLYSSDSEDTIDSPSPFFKKNFLKKR